MSPRVHNIPFERILTCIGNATGRGISSVSKGGRVQKIWACVIKQLTCYTKQIAAINIYTRKLEICDSSEDSKFIINHYAVYSSAKEK